VAGGKVMFEWFFAFGKEVTLMPMIEWLTQAAGHKAPRQAG
jgi:hypothetical protein